MGLVPLIGHEGIRARLRGAAQRGRLPSSLLLHGPRGVGKQRLALWLGQLLLCEGPAEQPCGRCQHCRYSSRLEHPDLLWFFPRPRMKDTDPPADAVLDEYREAVAERVEADGLYAPADGSEAIYVAVVRALVRQAALFPALARRKVFVVGDAERMVPQEGSEQAANAFLKLLEEPPADTTLILTTSEPGALLPTIRSRLVAIRVPRLPDRAVREFLDLEPVQAALVAAGVPPSTSDRVDIAQGAPGTLIAAASQRDALNQAERMLKASLSSDAADRYRFAFTQGSTRARGAFTQMLDALTVVLNRRLRAQVADAVDTGAAGTSRAIEAVERAKTLATGNVNPQLVSAALMRDLRRYM